MTTTDAGITKSPLLTPVKLALSCTLCASLLACGGSDDNDAEPPIGSTPTPSPTASPAGGWTLVWQDEFDGDAIDASKWEFEVNCWGGGNNEQQCYTDRSDNAFVEDGHLKILARREDFSGPNTPDGSAGDEATLPYTSARLRTRNQGDWTYGRFEIRAKLPQGQGTWPAIWMLPTDYTYGTWAASGEIDIMEAVNLKTQSDAAGASEGTLEARVHGTLHYGEAWPQNVSSGAEYLLPNQANPADDFHVYAIEWEEGEIRWYVDETHFATQRESGWYSRYSDDNGDKIVAPIGAPFNERFHLLVNLAVGGNWAGNANSGGIDESAFPQTLEVDYVRVYECSHSPSTGAGCATIDDSVELVEGHTPPVVVDPDSDYGDGPLYTLFDDGLSEGLAYDSFDPDELITYGEVDEDGRGKVLNICKTGATGNMYFAYTPGVDLSDFSGGELVFDINVTSAAEGTQVLIKIDSGWPNASDTSIALPTLNQWQEIRIDVNALVASGNSITPGSANITSVFNPFVVEPSGAIELLIDNVRFEEGQGNTLAQIDLPITFEDSSVDYSMVNFGGAATTLVADPSGATNTVARSLRSDTSLTYAGTTMSTASGLASAIAVTADNSVMKVRVYSPAANLAVRLKLEDASNSGHSVETEALTARANEWETLTFDFNNHVANTPALNATEWTYDKASIFFNFGATGADAGEQVFYWDDVRIED